MSFHPPKVRERKGKGWGGGPVPGTERLVVEVTKGRNRVQEPDHGLVSRGDRCPFKDGFQSAVSPTYSGKTII